MTDYYDDYYDDDLEEDGDYEHDNWDDGFDSYDDYDYEMDNDPDAVDPPYWLFWLSELRWKINSRVVQLRRRCTRCKDCGKWGTADDNYCDNHLPIPF